MTRLAALLPLFVTLALASCAAAFNVNDEYYPNQWHLHTTTAAVCRKCTNLDTELVWDTNVAGATRPTGGRSVPVNIAFIDSGIELRHPELLENPLGSVNLTTMPMTAFDWSGTANAALAVARANNSLCGVGVAFNATFSSIHLVDGADIGAKSGTWLSDKQATALSYKNNVNFIYSNSWGPPADGFSLMRPQPEVLAQINASTTEGRSRYGSIFVWPAGDGGELGLNTNNNGFANLPQSITVGAVDAQGLPTSYTQRGACVLVCAPSSSSGGGIAPATPLGLTTADRVVGGLSPGQCTSSFGGTAASAAMVSGVVALMLGASPSLTWRDVQHILLRTAEHDVALDNTWVENGAGLRVHEKYGFGIVNAQKALMALSTWRKVGPRVSLTGNRLHINSRIPDNAPLNPLNSTYLVDVDVTLEHVQVMVNITHGWRGDLKIVLISPLGTHSILTDVHGASTGGVPAYNSAAYVQLGTAQFLATPSEFGPLIAPVTARVVAPTPADGCRPFTNTTANAINGSIVVFSSAGNCSYAARVARARQAGAVGVLVANSLAGPTFRMRRDPQYPKNSIPALMISPDVAERIKASKTAVTLGQYQRPSTNTGYFEWKFLTNRCWGESSRGIWKLQVHDMLASETDGTLVSWQLTLHGTGDVEGQRTSGIMWSFVTAFLVFIVFVGAFIGHAWWHRRSRMTYMQI